jgi:hypothetical protein
MKTALLFATLALSAPVLAQDQPGVPLKVEGPTSVSIAPTPPQPSFTSLAKKGPDGKVMRLEGVVDIAAFAVNPLIDAATLARIRPAVLEWIADVDQLAIDNLDFIERLEPAPGQKGLLDKVDVEDKVQITQMSQMMNQLMSAGPLTATLEVKQQLTKEQSGLNQTITSDYLQQCMNEIQAEPVPAELAGNEQAIRNWRVNNLTKFLYHLSCKDPIASFQRMLVDAAKNIDRVVDAMNLSGDQASKVRAEIPAVKAAATRQEQRAAVRRLMGHLSFEQRREFLTRTREVAPLTDPYLATSS